MMSEMVQQFDRQRHEIKDDSFIDFGRLLRALWRYKWGILGLASVIALIAGFLVSGKKPVYRATVSIALESSQANVVNVEEVYSLGASNHNYLQTQYEILKSRSMAEGVVRRLQLHKHPAFVADDTDNAPWFRVDLSALLPARKKEPPVQLSQEEKDERAIQAITNVVAGGLRVSPVQYSYIVYLSFQSTDRRLAAQIVNAVAKEFINTNLQNRIAGTMQATEWLSNRMSVLKENLRESEYALQAFREREGLVDIGGVTSLGGSELESLSQRLQDATRLRIDAQNIKESVRLAGNASTGELMSIAAVREHQTISDMKREYAVAERKVAELSKRYGAKHPKMITAQSDLNAAQRNLNKEVSEVVSGIGREYRVALRNEQELKARWSSRKAEMQEFNRIQFRLRELQQEVDTNRQLYDIFLTRIKTVSETGGFEKPHARIVDRAMIPSSPIGPNKKRSVVMAFIVGIMLGSGITILLEFFDNTIKTPDDVQTKLGVPLLGALPKMKCDKSGSFEQFWQKPQGQFAEALRTVRTGLVLSGLDDPAKIIVVTSSVAGEGKSTIALNLGAALGQMERTLVIGADLRRPSLAKRCGLSPGHPGLSHFVSGAEELDACIEELEALGVHVMPSGLIPPNPLEMISSKRFVDALGLLGEQFDRIVLDSAPVQAVSDALILATYADSVVYVVKADDTSATQVQKGIDKVMASGQSLTGVVLNQFDLKSASKYYGSDYYQNYGYQSKEA